MSDITALYPYAIMSYSAFVTILAIYLWKLTNRNVDGTRHNIETQVATAVVDIRAQLDAALASQQGTFSAIRIPTPAEIASEVENAVNANLEALREEIGVTVGNHVMMAIRQEQAQATKGIQAQLEAMGVPSVIEEGKEAVLASMPPQLLQAQRLLQMKVSKKYASEHPIEAQALEAGKLWVMQMMGGMTGQGQQVASPAPSNGFGVR